MRLIWATVATLQTCFANKCLCVGGGGSFVLAKSLEAGRKFAPQPVWFRLEVKLVVLTREAVKREFSAALSGGPQTTAPSAGTR